MSRELKSARTFDEQLALLEERDMLIDDHDKAVEYLKTMNYYRISGYSYLFQGNNNRYRKGTHFEAIIKIMDFDRDMRRVLITALEVIEIYARTQIAYWFSLNHEHDGGAYYDPANFRNEGFHTEMIDNLEKQIDRNNNQLFVQHHIQSYNRKMPLWCAVEILSFSTISKMYSNMLDADRDIIARSVDTDKSYLTNWLHCFSVLRNYCAHYARLYYVQLSPPVSLDPKTLRAYKDIKTDTLFAYIIAIMRILPDESQRETLRNSIVDLIETYKDYISLEALGFPESWLKMLFDKTLIHLKPVVKPNERDLRGEEINEESHIEADVQGISVV